MDTTRIASRIDSIIRVFLYILIFWLPYSPAVIEVCVSVSLLLWVGKRLVLSECHQASTWGEGCKRFFKAFRMPSSCLNLPAAFFLLVCVLSVGRLFRSPLFGLSLHGFLTKTLEWFIVYFLVLEVFTEKRHFKIASWVFLFTAFSTAIDSFIQFYATGKDIFNGRGLTRGGATAGFSHANGLSSYWTIAVPFAFSLLFLPFKKRKKRILHIVVFFVLGWSMVLTFSRGAWFGIFVVAFLALLASRQRKILYPLAAVIIGLFSVYLFVPLESQQCIRLDVREVRSTADWRINIWKDSFKMIREKPVLGHGLNTYMRLFQNYRRKFGGEHPFGPTYAHNCFVQVWAEVGTLGLLGFLWMLAALFLYTGKVVRRSRAAPLGGIMAGCMAYLIHSFFDTSLYSLQLSVYFWFAAGIMISASQMIAKSMSSPNH